MAVLSGKHTHDLVRVQHGLGPRLALVAGTPNNLGSPKLVLPSLGTLVTNTWSAEHLVEGELFYKLSPSVRRYVKPFDVILSITLVM